MLSTKVLSALKMEMVLLLGLMVHLWNGHV